MSVELALVTGIGLTSLLMAYIASNIDKETRGGLTWKAVYLTLAQFWGAGTIFVAITIADQNGYEDLAGFTLNGFLIGSVFIAILWIMYLVLMFIEDATRLAIRRKAKTLLKRA